MLDAKTQFQIEPALAVLTNVEHARYNLVLEHCLCLFVTAQQHYLRSNQQAFQSFILDSLLEIYANSHQSFMTETSRLLETLIVGQLLEPSFDLGLVSKLKVAEKFYQKAITKLAESEISLDIELVYQHYFHTIATSLTYCVDVHLDALRVSESAIHAYQRQQAAEECPIAQHIEARIAAALSFVAKSRKEIQHLRQILIEANLHVGQTDFLTTWSERLIYSQS